MHTRSTSAHLGGESGGFGCPPVPRGDVPAGAGHVAAGDGPIKTFPLRGLKDSPPTSTTAGS